MRKQSLYGVALATAVLVGTAAEAFAQTTPPDETPVVTETNDDDGFDWGWLGLLGLIGLAGLRGRKDDHRVTTGDHAGRPRV